MSSVCKKGEFDCTRVFARKNLALRGGVTFRLSSICKKSEFDFHRLVIVFVKISILDCSASLIRLGRAGAIVLLLAFNYI